MVNINTAKQLALALPEVEEKSHFEKPDFRLRKKIFASLHTDKNIMMIKLSAVDQSVFHMLNAAHIYPVPGGWGRKGATLINLSKVRRSTFLDALTTAWKTTAPSKLVTKYYPRPA